MQRDLVYQVNGWFLLIICIVYKIVGNSDLDMWNSSMHLNDSGKCVNEQIFIHIGWGIFKVLKTFSGYLLPDYYDKHNGQCYKIF